MIVENRQVEETALSASQTQDSVCSLSCLTRMFGICYGSSDGHNAADYLRCKCAPVLAILALDGLASVVIRFVCSLS